MASMPVWRGRRLSCRGPAEAVEESVAKPLLLVDSERRMAEDALVKLARRPGPAVTAQREVVEDEQLAGP